MKRLLASIPVLAAAAVLGAAKAPARVPARGLVLDAPGTDFRVADFTRDPVGPKDILIEILYSGICHSDIHAALNDGGGDPAKTFPIVPGHEIVGRVTQVGAEVATFKVGDIAGVGCFVDSCGACDQCGLGREQFCRNRDPQPNRLRDGRNFRGGYSNRVVVPERNAIHIPAGADLKRVPPLLCAGVTVWSPIHASKVKQGDRVGVAGFGGLGHMAVKYLVALGAEVTVFDVTDAKRDDALRLGAKRYVNVREPNPWEGMEDSFDFILSTIPAADYRVGDYLRLVRYDGGEMAVVGLPPGLTISLGELMAAPHRRLYGSIVVVFGDGIAAAPDKENWPADGWRARVEMARLFVDCVNRHGGDATLLLLPERGLHGNTHFPFADTNSEAVADQIAGWLRDKDLD